MKSSEHIFIFPDFGTIADALRTIAEAYAAPTRLPADYDAEFITPFAEKLAKAGVTAIRWKHGEDEICAMTPAALGLDTIAAMYDPNAPFPATEDRYDSLGKCTFFWFEWPI